LKEKENILFKALKKAVTLTFLKEHPASSPEIGQWKGDDIVRFQEDLLEKVKGRVSEKWFYTYFKNTPDKLPRIDILNLLSQYAGYQNWADFKQNHQSLPAASKTSGNYKKYFLAGIVLVVLVISGIIFWQKAQVKQVRFCFDTSVDLSKQVEVREILPDESEKLLHVKNHCVTLNTVGHVQLKITSPYYADKIIKRKIEQDNYHEIIQLQPDLIAFLLQHYSDSDTENWQKRRQWLQQIISDKAMIFQQLQDQGSIELYDKDEFIAGLCIPTGWLKHIEILEIAYQNNQVIKLRFRLKNHL